MSFGAGLVIGLIAGGFGGELLALAALRFLYRLAERRDHALENGADR